MRMTKGKYSQAMRTMGVTGLAFALSYGISLVLTPYLTEKVGAEAYGFVSLARQCAQYALIITMALDSFAARHIALEYHRGNLGQANVFFSSAFFGDAALATAVFGAAALGICFLERLLRIPEGMVRDVKLLFLLVFANFWITTVFGVYSSAAYIKNKLDAAGLFKGLSYLAEALVLILLYSMLPTRILYVGAGLMAAALVTAGANVWICRKYAPALSPRRKDFSPAAVKRLVVDGVWTSVNSLGELLNGGLDLLICNLMLYPAAMGQLAVAKTIYSIFGSMFVVVSQAFQPMLLKSYAAGDQPGLLRELGFSMKISGMFSNLGFAGFMALGQAYYKLWMPGQDSWLLYTLTALTIATVVPGGPMQPLYYIYTLTVKKKIPCLITILGGLLNVAAMYVLIRYMGMGIYAVAGTTAAVMAVINFVTNPLYMAHVLCLPWHTFYPGILRNLLSCGMLILLFGAFVRAYTPDTWAALIGCILIYTAVGAAVHLMVVCGRGDWAALRRFLTEKGGKING